jgi:nifR3 family TIM-barrel protein
MDFRNLLILAPLAGVTDSPFRLLCREAGADAVVTEMVSARGVVEQPERSARFLAFREEERPVGVQLFGADPEFVARAAEAVARMGYDFLDLNMGCPVTKVTRGGSGAALLSDPALAGRLVAAAAGAAGIPVTVKTRAGTEEGELSCIPLAEAAFGSGAAAVTIHPRTRRQMFSGRADWTVIRRVKEAFPDRVVIGNGDVHAPGDAARMALETGCDAVMVGRGAMGNPWIFTALKGEYPPGRRPSPPPFPTPEERREAILRHGREAWESKGVRGIVEMRKHLAWYSRGGPGAAAFRGRLASISTLDDFRAAVEILP